MRRVIAALAIAASLGVCSPAHAAFTFTDLTCETTSTTGTGTLDLAGAATGYLSFIDAGITSGATVPYQIRNGSQFETGIGTFTDDTPDTLARDPQFSTDGLATALDLSGSSTVCIGPISSAWLGGVADLNLNTLEVGGHVFADDTDKFTLTLAAATDMLEVNGSIGAIGGNVATSYSTPGIYFGKEDANDNRAIQMVTGFQHAYIDMGGSGEDFSCRIITTIASDDLGFQCDTGSFTFSGGDVTVTSASLIAGNDLTATDDVFVGDDLSVGGAVVIADASGTATLQNIDALDATTESTIEAAMDTLANVTSIGGDVTAGGDFISTDDVIVGDDLLIASAGVINFASGDCTATHSSNAITWAGGCAITHDAAFTIGNNAMTVGSLELGNATDTTIAKGSAGQATVEGKPILTVIGVQSLTSGSGATYTPTSGTKFVKVTCTGAGGGGGGGDTSASPNMGAGAGGEAGGTAIIWYDATELGTDAVYTIGTGGTAGSGTNGTAGGDGNDTTFNPQGSGATITGAGGDGGDGSGANASTASNTVGGVGEGTATSGDVNILGGEGQNGFGAGNTTTGFAKGGDGGISFWGGGGKGGSNASTSTGSQAGRDGTAYGSGGGGGVAVATATGVAGGVGKDGICVVEEYGS